MSRSASDGSDLRKGYPPFCFGVEKQHRFSAAYRLRNGVVVARSSATIPKTMDYMRHWFRYKIQREGGKLRFSIDGRDFSADGIFPELKFDDPQPLTGNRIAIWTYDSTISIAKVRIAGETDGNDEPPDFKAEPVRTVYDK